jgi:hypothetical protein
MKTLGVYLLIGISVFGLVDGLGQSTAETALLFSRTTPGGSARVLGMGGTQVSLGGDFSSAGSNPAGLGMFNRSEFSITPSYSWSTTQSEYFENKTDELKTRLSIPSLSYVLHRDNDGETWLGGTFAITLNRLNDFNSTMRYEGTNPYNSIADYFTGDSYGIDPNDFEDEYYNTLNRLAYDTYLIDADPSNNSYWSHVGIITQPNNLPPDLPRSLQTETIKTTGAQNQWSLSYGANFSDRFFFGAALHIRTLRYRSQKTYTESDYYFESDPDFDPLDNFILEEDLRIVGSGFTGTFGAIVRPVDGLQIGVSLNTPTSYLLHDTYNAKAAADWDNFRYYTNGTLILNGVYDAQLDEIVSDYKLKTPGRISVGGTFFFKKAGFVSADLDFIDYSNAKYNSQTDGVNYDEDNNQISSLYKAGINARLGGEYRLKDFRFRTGFGFQNDPFVEKQNGVSREIVNYALGFGYRTSRFYIDAALSYALGNNSYRPYNVTGSRSPLVSVKNSPSSFSFTLGFPF